MNAPIRLAGSSLRLPVPIVTLTALPFPGLCGVPAARDANAPRALAGDARGAGYCVSRLRRRGGVATQRPAKPFTPVRFRSAPLAAGADLGSVLPRCRYATPGQDGGGDSRVAGGAAAWGGDAARLARGGIVGRRDRAAGAFGRAARRIPRRLSRRASGTVGRGAVPGRRGRVRRGSGVGRAGGGAVARLVAGC